MARPLPDPAYVLAVFERKHYDGDSFVKISEWSRSQPWGPISVGSAHAWYKQALAWWNAEMRLSPEEEYAGLRVGLDLVADEIVTEYRKRRLDVDRFAQLSIKLSAEIRALTGAGLGGVQQQAPEISARARQAIDELREKRERKELSK